MDRKTFKKRNHLIHQSFGQFLAKDTACRAHDSNPNEQRVLLNCALCSGQGSFKFTPQFPQSVQNIAQAMNLYKTQDYACPFCEIRNLQQPCFSSTSLPIVNIKQEDNRNDSSVKQWFGLSKEELLSVSCHTAAVLINKHGLPPSIVFRALLRYPSNTFDLLHYVEQALINELELLQLRIQQNVSHEVYIQSKIFEAAAIESAIASGHLQELETLDPDLYTKCFLKSETMKAFLLPGVTDVSNTNLNSCFCGENYGSDYAHEAYPCIFKFLKSYLGYDIQKRRVTLFRLLQLLKRSEKWYKKPAIEYFRKWKAYFHARLQFLDMCIEMYSYPLHVSLKHQDWETFVHQSCSLSLTRLRTSIASVILLDYWIKREFSNLQEQLLTPDPNNCMAIPRLFREKLNHVIQHVNQSNDTDCVPFLVDIQLESCCFTFLQRFIIKPNVWGNTSDTFWIPFYKEKENGISMPYETNSSDENSSCEIVDDALVENDSIVHLV